MIFWNNVNYSSQTQCNAVQHCQDPHIKYIYSNDDECCRSPLHDAPIFCLLLKVAVNGMHQCDCLKFLGSFDSNITNTDNATLLPHTTLCGNIDAIFPVTDVKSQMQRWSPFPKKWQLFIAKQTTHCKISKTHTINIFIQQYCSTNLSLRKGQQRYEWRLAEVRCLLVERCSSSCQAWLSRSFLQFRRY